jgi:hypothetical protein
VGVETAEPEALRAAKKKQNLHRDLVADVRRFYRHGIGVQAGIMVGFDSDTRDSFRRQAELIQQAAIPTITLNLLNAPHGTPLLARMKTENRLVTDFHFEDFATNIVPFSMSIEELIHGTRWLANRVYAPEQFLARLRDFASCLPDESRSDPGARHSVLETKRGLAIWDELMRAFTRLGPAFRRVVTQSLPLFRRKNKRLLPVILLEYRHVVSRLQSRGVFDPALGALPEPAFDALPRAARAAEAGARSRWGDAPRTLAS